MGDGFKKGFWEMVQQRLHYNKLELYSRGEHRESKTPNFIQSRFFENPTVIRSNFAQFAPNNVLKGKIFGYFLGFSKNYRIKSRSNVEKYPIMIRILSNQLIGYFLERDWVFGRSIFTERIFFGVFGSL